MTNMVEKPPHYTQTKIEAIDYLEDTLGEGFSYFLEGNVKKYMHRWRYKNRIEDLKKARWYLDRLIQLEDVV